MVNGLARRAAAPPPLLWALLGLLIPGLGSAALPPPKETEVTQDVSAGNAAPAAAPVSDTSAAFARALAMLPQLRFGASVAYSAQRDISAEHTSKQSGLETNLAVKGAGFIWQPWIARYTCSANARMSQNNSSGEAEAVSNRNVNMTGTGQLSVFPASTYPFEAHFSRNESRSTSSSDLSVAQTYAGQSYGFSQSYGAGSFRITGGWDRSLQNAGLDRQDVLQLNSSVGEESRHVDIAASLARNLHEEGGATQMTQQSSLSLINNLVPNETITVDNLASVSQADYHLLRANGSSRVSQISSIGSWRPEEIELTVIGGVRLLTSQSQSASQLGTTLIRQNDHGSNANFNLGANYELFQYTRLNAAANVNVNDSNGQRDLASNQAVGIGYQPDYIDLGGFNYNWSTNASANRNSGREASHGATVQLSHSLNRNLELSPGSTLGLGASQNLSLVAKSATSAERNAANNVGNTSGVGSVNAEGVRKQLSNSLSASWNKSGEAASMTTQLGVSDSRSLGGREEFFQAVYLQFSSSVPASATSSWVGNLTTQISRQSAPQRLNPDAERVDASPITNTNSSASLVYQQQRLFGVRRLRLTSDLRLNGQALLPLFGGPQDQEMAAWDSRIDYVIGRTQFRLSFLVARLVSPALNADPHSGQEIGGTRVARVNKSIAFAVSRAIGDL